MITMKHLIYLCFFSLLSQGALSQSQLDFTVCFADSIKSTILNEHRSLLIYTPYADTKTKPSTTETYPVLYVFEMNCQQTNNLSFSYDVSYLKSGSYPKTTGMGEDVVYISFKSLLR